jgi:hypothetical protein
VMCNQKPHRRGLGCDFSRFYVMQSMVVYDYVVSVSGHGLGRIRYQHTFMEHGSCPLL